MGKKILKKGRGYIMEHGVLDEWLEKYKARRLSDGREVYGMAVIPFVKEGENSDKAYLVTNIVEDIMMVDGAPLATYYTVVEKNSIKKIR